MSGKAAYSIEVLDIFSRYLHCSYDFLLGKSLTPNREFHDMKEVSRLTDGAIERILLMAKSYDTSRDCRRYIDTLSTIISYDFLLDRISEYFYLDSTKSFVFDDKNPTIAKLGITIGGEHLSVPSIEDAYFLSIVNMLGMEFFLLVKKYP